MLFYWVILIIHTCADTPIQQISLEAFYDKSDSLIWIFFEEF